MEIVFPGVCHDLLECEDAVNVPFGLFPQEEIIIVVFLLYVHLFGQEADACIVGGGCQGPGAEPFVCFCR